MDTWPSLFCTLKGNQYRAGVHGKVSGGPDLTQNQGFETFSVISGLWRDRWRAVWISTILTFHGGAIRAIRIFCR